MALAHTAIEVERHYGAPQDMEFALDDHHIWIVQSRPITTLDRPPAGDAVEVPGTLLVSGSPPPRCRVGRRAHPPLTGRGPPAPPRRGAGGADDQPGLGPHHAPGRRLVTDGGGVTCHAAIVGAAAPPTVVATRKATSVLRDGELVTVDGTAGEVREGREPARPAGTLPAAAAAGPALAPPTTRRPCCT